MDAKEELLREILRPGEEFSPMPFWFFNDAFDEEKVKSQLEDYVEKGVNGFVLHPRIGVPEEMPYLSEEYFRAVRFIVATAAKLGMKVALYDEGMYPSGSAHGKVAEADPEYAAKGIIPLDAEAAKAKLAAEKGAQTVAERRTLPSLDPRAGKGDRGRRRKGLGAGRAVREDRRRSRRQGGHSKASGQRDREDLP